MTNFQFLPPKLEGNDEDGNEIQEESEIKELNPAKVFNNERRFSTLESDEDEDLKGVKDYTQPSSGTYNSNSTSATSTFTDHMDRFTKNSLPEVKDETAIHEFGAMDIDPIEWQREVNRVSKDLEDFSQKVEDGDITLLMRRKIRLLLWL